MAVVGEITLTRGRNASQTFPPEPAEDIPAINWSSRHIFGLRIVASVREAKEFGKQKQALPLSGRRQAAASASIMLKRYDVDHPKAQRHPLFTLLDHTSAPVSFVGRCYAFIVGSASHEFASPLIVDVGGGDDAFVSIHAAFASTKFGW